MSKYTPMDLETDDSTDATLALVMKALVSTGSHFTDCIRFSANLGRGISLFMRVQVPKARVSELREALGRRCELKEPPRAKTNARGSTR